MGLRSQSKSFTVHLTLPAKKAALIPTCYAGHINETLSFASGALKDYRVIAVAMHGNGEASAPSIDPDFPSDYSLMIRLSKFSVPVDHGAVGVSKVWMLLLDIVWVVLVFLTGLLLGCDARFWV